MTKKYKAKPDTPYDPFFPEISKCILIIEFILNICNWEGCEHI